MNVANILDSITDDIASIIAAVRGTPAPITTQQTNAALVLATEQQKQRTLMMLGLGALAVFAFTRR